MLEVIEYKSFKILPLNELAFKTMIEACFLLDKYWLESGTLLGIYRDNNFIPNDHDIDIGIMYSEDIEEDLIKRFTSNGFSYGRYSTNGKIQQMVFTKYGNLIDLWIWHNKDDVMINQTEFGLAKQPYLLFNPLGEYNFRGETFLVPNNIEKYLNMRFKNWKTPKNGRYWCEYANFID